MAVLTQSYVRGPSEPKLLDWNIAQLLDIQSQQYGARVALVSLHQNVRLTYSDLRLSVREIALRLVEHGISPGDRIAILAGNCVEFVQILFATMAIGAIAVLLPLVSNSDELVKSVTSVELSLIFMAERIGYRSSAETLRRLANAHEGRVVVIGSEPLILPPAGCVSFRDYQSPSFVPNSRSDGDGEAKLGRFWGKVSQSSPCCFQFTSGTTGPRSVSMLSHRNLVNNAYLVGYQLQLSASDRLCCSPPLSHCFGLVCGLLASYTHGATLVMPSEIFDPALSLQCLREENCTVVHAVPSMFDAMLRQAKKPQQGGGVSAVDYKLRSGFIAGSTPPKNLLRSLREQLGLERLIYPFAVCSCTSVNHSLIDDNTSVGTALPHTAMKIIDNELGVMPVDVPGELCVSGYLVHLGYFRNGEKTKATTHTDDSGTLWFHTGDIATLDKNGRCKIIGRSKDMIKKHGENIAPRDIEDVLLAHSSVGNAAVVGIPDEKSGEAVVAFVELRNRGTVDARQLRIWLRERKLTPHKMPDHFITIGDVDGCLTKMPLNATGKILKTELRSFAQNYVGV
ncbi:putative amp dependent CoA ligase [Nemania sp. NC0429]|nr:putative amp dependent CoA ligase [Nemania sp. NC0429]